MTSLATKYQPRRLDEVILPSGIQLVLEALVAGFRKAEMDWPRILLLAGPSGCGKSTVVSLLDQELPFAYKREVLDEVHHLDGATLLETICSGDGETLRFWTTTKLWAVEPGIFSHALVLELPPIPLKPLCGRLAEVCRLEGLNYEPRALIRIGQRSRGDLRAAFLALEEVALLGQLSLENTEALFPAREEEFAEKFFQAVREGNSVLGNRVIREGYAFCRDSVILIDALTLYLSRESERICSGEGGTWPGGEVLRLMRLCFEARAQACQLTYAGTALLVALFHLMLTQLKVDKS